ncbi:MAG: exo-alpha-sialidase [Phycisphaerae bacterium]|nr:exo-alpha-sialidase [Phycisphaerae bacterium]
MTFHESRRDFIKRAGAGMALGALTTGLHPFVFAQKAAAVKTTPAPYFEIISHGQVSAQKGIFCGWPTIAITKENELLVVASAREDHVDPFGRVFLFRSHDLGETWTWPQCVYDGPLDDRDTGILVTNKGTLLVTAFTQDGGTHLIKAQQERLAKGVAPKPGEFAITGERYERWLAASSIATPEQREREVNRCWMLRSTDDGMSWSRRYDCQVSSPHGPFQLRDGRILFPGRDHSPKVHIRVVQSTDDGKNWKWLSDIPIRSGDDPAAYHELHGVEAADGTITVQIRNHNTANCNETLQTESHDGGHSWTKTHSIGVPGFPSHLICLKDGRLLMTYSYRDGDAELARVSDDSGQTWSEPITLWHIDNMGHDYGYPASVQLPDGSIQTVWYEVIKGTWIAVIRSTHWRLL